MRLSLAAVAVALSIIATQAVPGGAAEPAHKASSSAAAVTPTYVSELGPASVLAPREADELPASGTGGPAGSASPAVLGTGLAVLGAFLIFAARRVPLA